MSDSYLDLARSAIKASGKPLTPQEMLNVARQGDFLPDHLYGRTMHKTLMARLSENIRLKGAEAEFFRTAPGVFFLHSIAKLPETPNEFKIVHRGHLRSKSIRKEDVLVAPKSMLEKNFYGDFVPFEAKTFKEFYNEHCLFVDRSSAEENHKLKQFVTFTLVFSETKILTYRRGKFTTTSEKLKGQKTVGFGGHVNNTDFNLFHHGDMAFKANAARELREELFLDHIYENFESTMAQTEILGYVNVDGDFDAEHHIAVLVAFKHKGSELPKKGELSINQLSWLDLSEPCRDIDEFDFWSKIILENLYAGKISRPA